MSQILEYQCQAEKEEANGEFERDERTWYPTQFSRQTAVCSMHGADGERLSLPTVPPDIPRRSDGKPDISGYFLADAGGANHEARAAGARLN